MTPAALRALAALVEARKTRDLARLDGLLGEDRRLTEEIAALRATPARDLATGEAFPMAQQALRLNWVDGRIRAASRRRVELAAQIRKARAEAIRSLGKHRALEELARRAEADRSRMEGPEDPPPVPPQWA